MTEPSQGGVNRVGSVGSIHDHNIWPVPTLHVGRLSRPYSTLAWFRHQTIPVLDHFDAVSVIMTIFHRLHSSEDNHLFGLHGNLNFVLRSHSRPAVVVTAARYVLLQNLVSTPLNLVDLCAAVDISTDGKILANFTLYGRHNSSRIPSLKPLCNEHRFAPSDI